jgi:hypothetical protein
MIPADESDSLLARKAAPTKVLTDHVVPGTVMADDVRTGAVETVQAPSREVFTPSSGRMLEDANVIGNGNGNGVSHVIDTVVLPNRRGARVLPDLVPGDRAAMHASDGVWMPSTGRLRRSSRDSSPRLLRLDAVSALARLRVTRGKSPCRLHRRPTEGAIPWLT